jgi:hypothetical protein
MTGQRSSFFIAAAGVFVVGLGPALAQAPPTHTTPPPPSATVPAPDTTPKAGNCPPARSAPRNTEGGSGTTTGQAGQSLSDQLARSDGVICPPGNVDPEMRAPTPGGGNTPVIPPPGSPGGNPNVQPK